jgi:hypothetical protein
MKKHLMLFVVALTSISVIFGLVDGAPMLLAHLITDTGIIVVNLKELKYLGGVMNVINPIMWNG